MFRKIAFLIILSFLLAACGSNPYDRDTFIAANVEAFDLGQQVYIQNCASCHGINGEGVASQPAPPHDSTGHTWHHDDDTLLRIIYYGGSVDLPEDQRMPAFADILSDQEVEAVLLYIKTFWSDSERKSQQGRTNAVRGS